MHKSRATEFRTVAPNICGSSVWNVLHFSLFSPLIMKWLLENLCTPCIHVYHYEEFKIWHWSCVLPRTSWCIYCCLLLYLHYELMLRVTAWLEVIMELGLALVASLACSDGLTQQRYRTGCWVIGLLVYGIVVCFYWRAPLLRWRMQSAAAFAKDLNIGRPSYEDGQKMRAWRLGANCVTRLLAPGVSKFCPIRNLGRHEGDLEHVLYWGYVDIRGHRRTYSRPGFVHPWRTPTVNSWLKE